MPQPDENDRDAGFPRPNPPPPSRDLLRSWLDFLELTDADADEMRALREDFEEYAEPFIEEFYRHLFRFRETARFLHDPAVVARLRESQKAHFCSMLEANWDADYVAQRRQVGAAHAEVGIEPRYFLGAYNQYMQLCFRHFAKARGDLADEDLRWMLALLKGIVLDIGLTLDAYFAQSTELLRKALDMFWRANNELRRFAQLTSHDLKTPLATVANLCDEAIDEFGDEMPADARQLVRSASERTFRMSAMIDELLASATLPPDEADRCAIDAKQLIGEAADRLRPLLQEKSIELEFQGPLPEIWGDRAQLREVFYNLLVNAAKYADKQPARITARGEARGPKAIVCIEDEGPGIPSDELERIFVPFRRLQQHRSQPGSGLGLYFTKNIVEEHGGRIWAESAVGRGAAFFVELDRPVDDAFRRE